MYEGMYVWAEMMKRGKCPTRTHQIAYIHTQDTNMNKYTYMSPFMHVGIVGVWHVGTIGGWHVGIIGGWHVGIIGVWHVGIIVVWHVGIVGVWHVGIIGVWHVGIVGVWHVGIIGVWLPVLRVGPHVGRLWKISPHHERINAIS
jgi:hypothetical protein